MRKKQSYKFYSIEEINYEKEEKLRGECVQMCKSFPGVTRTESSISRSIRVDTPSRRQDKIFLTIYNL